MARKTRTKTRYPGVYREGERLVVRVTMRDAAGKRRELCRYSEATEPEAAAVEVAELRLELKRTLEQEVATTTRSSGPARPVTCADYVERWLEHKTNDGLRDSVIDHYTDTLGRLFLPCPAPPRHWPKPTKRVDLGEVPIEAVTRDDVLHWVAWMQNQKCRKGTAYARATLDSIWRVVRPLLRDAAAEYGRPDPTNRVRGPKSNVRGVRESATLSGEQLGVLLAAVKRQYPTWWPEVTVMAFSGMRPGELYELRWGDIDEAAGVVHIERAHRRGDVHGTKTDEPRDAALTDELRDAFKAQRQHLVRVQHPGLLEAHEKGPLVFPAATGGHRGPEALLKVLRLAGKAAGIPTKVGPQVMRRTFNTLAVLSGVDRIVLRAQLGHTEEEMTERYAGVPAEAKAEAVGRVIALTGLRAGG